ncbi:hypothetical protein [Corynebacterium cystitidis]|uniref:Uncharacterized protein n=1 Tax=Corynebacterium cystitidis DSM 20524 TaxID=1121357 RepID=A0A1H9TBV4_9CORY|nr:hypothetical protein [Corynebacterium cystitidis]WJY83533.1 hypothetical protein CCYS_13245 [Corynebacterium cystitidis DSM 20524]SER94269.1 hypothetical protein SAMN05661109_01389 [Corynebacterium cystitidis DSM 20524]SNV92252.1 potassium uptake system kup [Corynebacterium cystitidis]
MITVAHALTLVLPALAAPAAHANIVYIRPNTTPRTSLVVCYPMGNGGTSQAHQVRPALLLSKLHLGLWVSRHGAEHHKAQVDHLIRVSDERIVAELDRAYPHAIDEIARDYGLLGTGRNGFWGNVTTRAYDAARFVSLIRHDPSAPPVIQGMKDAAWVAADGTTQNYGTATLDTAQGTKFGWSDDKTSAMATVTLGPGWVAASMTYGDAPARTHDVQPGMRVERLSIPAEPGATAPPASPRQAPTQ